MKNFSPRRRTFLALLALAAILGGHTCPASAEVTSPWAAAADSKVRLVAGAAGGEAGQARLAGVELRLDPGWRTYWRNPGDSGVPPEFDWSGSKNLKSAEVLYPAPRRFDEAGGVAIGYVGDVLFPVKLTPERDGEPIELKLSFAYGLCKDLCIPNEVKLSLTLPAAAEKEDATPLDEALAQVPKEGKAGLLPQLAGVESALEGDAPKLTIATAFAQGASGIDLFIDGGDAYVPVPVPLGAGPDGKARFAVNFPSAAEAAAIKGKTLRLVLVSDQGSTETMWKAE